MKRLLFATAAAVALCASAAPSYADRVCSVTADLGTTCHYEPPRQRTETTAAHVDVLPVWGVTQPEFDCLSKTFLADTVYHTLLDVGRSAKGQSPDPIAECHIPDVRVAGAMDTLMRLYHDNHGGGASTWIESNCHAEPAIPRNKWVCTEGDVTREYR